MKEIRLDLIPFVCEALAVETIIYEDIDKLYEEYKDVFYENAKNSKYYSCGISNQSSVIVKNYYRKVLGIVIEVCNNNFNPRAKACEDYIDVEERFIKLIRKAYKRAYNFVKNSGSIVYIDRFYEKAFKKENHEVTTSEEMNREGLIILFLCNSSDKTINNEEFLDIIAEVFLRRTELEINKSYKIGISDISKENRKKVNEVKQRLNQRKNISLKLPCHYYYKILRNDYSFMSEYAEEENEALILAGEHLYDCNEFALDNNIHKKDLLTDRQVNEIIYSYVYMCNKDVDISKVELYYHFCKQIVYLVGLLKRERKFCEEHFSQGLELQLIDKEKECRKTQEVNVTLEDENEKLKKEIEELKRENKRLHNQIEDIDDNKNELIALREYMFKNKVEEEIKEEEIRNYSILNKCNGVIIGGSDAWQGKMKEELSEWKFISCSAENFDTNILANSEYIVININYMSHAMYYKIVSNSNRNKIIYLNNNNIARCLNEMYDYVNVKRI